MVLRYCNYRKWDPFSAVIRLYIVAAVSGHLVVMSCGPGDPSLRFVSVLHRHGERNPIFTYPTDPYRNATRYFPQGLGELLNKGKRNLFILGKFLRERYNGYIPSMYKPSEVLVLSVVLNRCIMSAQCLMAGLFPPVGSQIWNDNLAWQPAVEYPIPSSIDDILTVTKPCAALSKEREYVQTHLLQKRLDDNRGLVDYLSRKTGMDMNNVSNIDNLYDTLLVDEELGLALPEWTKSVYPDKLLPLFFLSETSDTVTPELRKLISGVLINSFVSSMKKKRALQGGWERRLNLYSAQDTTIIRLWRSMAIRQVLPKPNYGATFIVELHEVNGHWRVKLLYKNYALDTALSVIGIRGCEADEEKHKDGSCDLDIFAHSLEPVTLSDFDEECDTFN